MSRSISSWAAVMPATPPPRTMTFIPAILAAIGLRCRRSCVRFPQMAESRGKVLVTGGSGFLGSWCVVELLRRGYTVKTTVRSLAREAQVRAAVASVVDPDDRLAVLAADLMRDDGWPEAVEGCDYVLHVASPFPPKQPKDPDELIVPAREGTLRVLRASLDAGVRRIVVTSSIAAIRLSRGAAVRPLDESDWTDPDSPGLTPYVRSKTIAER